MLPGSSQESHKRFCFPSAALSSNHHTVEDGALDIKAKKGLVVETAKSVPATSANHLVSALSVPEGDASAVATYWGNNEDGTSLNKAGKVEVARKIIEPSHSRCNMMTGEAATDK